MTATRVMKGEGAGLVYELDCRCRDCRHGFLCADLLSFIKAMPRHARFILVGRKELFDAVA